MHVADKDLTTALSEQLDVPLAAAVYARMETALGLARWLGPLGNYLVARPAARSAAHDATERTDLPLDAAVVLAIAPGALHVWSADPMLSQVHDHLGSVPLERIGGVDMEVGKSWSALRLTFDDGEVLELQARGDVRGLVSAAADARGPAAG
jgi:hypothetical protein